MSDVRTERQGRILIVTLDRPKANAINAATSMALGNAFKQLQDDDSLSVGIITGGGDRFFSAGWDLKAAAEGEAPDADQGVGGFAGLTEYWDLKKPVIAAVNGMALGGGFELAIAADMIVSADTAEYAMPEAAIGVVGDSGGIIRLPRRIPRAIAMEMLMTGRRASAQELERWGLINRVVPKGKLMYAPPKDWTLAQRRALSNSLLVEYDNTWDAWNWKNSSGLIFNIDAMLKATDLSYSGSYAKGRTPGDVMTLSEYRAHYSVRPSCFARIPYGSR